MRKKPKWVATVLAVVVALLVICGTGGGLFAKATLARIGNDKNMIRLAIESPSGLSEQVVKGVETKFGERTGMRNIYGIADFSEFISNNDRLGYQVIVDYKKGPVTYYAYVATEGDSRQIVQFLSKEGAQPRRRIRQKLADAVR